MTTERDIKWPGHGSPGSQGIVIDRLRERIAVLTELDEIRYDRILDLERELNAALAKLAAKSHLRGLRKRQS